MITLRQAFDQRTEWPADRPPSNEKELVTFVATLVRSLCDVCANDIYFMANPADMIEFAAQGFAAMVVRGAVACSGGPISAEVRRWNRIRLSNLRFNRRLYSYIHGVSPMGLSTLHEDMLRLMSDKKMVRVSDGDIALLERLTRSVAAVLSRRVYEDVSITAMRMNELSRHAKENMQESLSMIHAVRKNTEFLTQSLFSRLDEIGRPFDMKMHEAVSDDMDTEAVG